MALEFKEVLKFLFPEYQIKESINERGFIAKKQVNGNKVVQSTNNVNAQQQEILSKSADTTSASSSQIQAKTESKKTGYTPAKESEIRIAKVTLAFEELPDEIQKYWFGTENDRQVLTKAFRRPYVKGFDNALPKNSILLLGTESRGKLYAIRCISEILKQKKVFRYSEVASLDMCSYSADSENTLFLSDLYKALNVNTENIVLENIDKATRPQLDIIYQLLTMGAYKLPKRYMLSNGSLVEATGILNASLISELSANGKYLIFTSTLPKTKIVSILGNRFVKEIADVIELEPISEEQIRDLAYYLLTNLVKDAKKHLHVEVTFDESVVDAVGKKYNKKDGIKGIKNHIENYLYESMAEMKLQDILWDDETINLSYDGDYFLLLRGGEKIYVSRFIRDDNEMELDELKKELEQVIGLNAVKEYVLSLETNFKVQKRREDKGLKKTDVSMHMIFVGNPGTGKTTIARIVAKYLKAIGVLSSGQMVEASRADLVGQYAGHTAVKTTELINAAIGGVLFIDEAYSLCRDKNDIFGLEAIDALVKGIEDNRDNLVVILAGYEDEMQEFLKSNTGLKSRFPNVVHFEDYTAEEMLSIAEVTSQAKGYRISDDCHDGLLRIFDKSQIKGRNDGGNGRLVRNTIEKAILEQSKRIADNPEDNMELLIAADFGFEKVEEFDLEKSLSKIIGMESVKSFIRTQYAMLEANKRRKNANMSVDTNQSLNMIFSGNPGTGKTTMARIMAEMFHTMGILKSGQLVETDRSGLVAGYVGQTANKTREVFEKALGGVLFIDEAYAITNDGSGFGQECIDTLVKLIEDYRGEIVVILAGYSKEMEEFMKSNSGLESRFPLQVEFPDYSVDELFEIGKQMIDGRGFVLDNSAEQALYDEIVRLKRHATASSGNGRMVRNLIEDIIRNQSIRIAASEIPKSELIKITAEDIKQQVVESSDFDLEEVFSKIVGLESVKTYIRSLKARLKMQEARKTAGLRTDNTQTMHMIFVGNPGTGKTMMARTVADVLYHMNVISTNKLVETDRSGLVAGYVGQTAIKTRQIVEKALDGVLFIDEAYSLAQGGENDFGQEAIDTLVKMMDDNRDRLVVILAGYKEDMQRFLNKNAGLQSRFARIIEFPDYSTDELMQIADIMYSEQGYFLDEGAKEELVKRINDARQNPQFGNSRYVRNLFEKSLNNQALRLSTDTVLTKEKLTMITASDLKEV